MAAKKAKELNEAEKLEYMSNFFDTFESLLVKKRLDKKSRKTKYKIQEAQSKWPKGIKREVTLQNGKKELTFTVEARPWQWTDGTVYVEIELQDARRIVVPKKLIRPKTQGRIFKPGFDLIYFLNHTDSVANYISAVEATIVDQGLIGSTKAFAEQLFNR